MGHRCSSNDIYGTSTPYGRVAEGGRADGGVGLGGRADGGAAYGGRAFGGLELAGRGVVVCGDGASDPGGLLELAERAGWPVLAEPSSGARRGPNALRCYPALL